MWSLVSIKQQSPRRPCDILVANVGPEVAKTAKTTKTAKCDILPKTVKIGAKLKMTKTALSGVSQQSSCQGVCQSVLCVPECFAHQSRPVQAQRPCQAFPSLLQLIPARSRPRSLAQLPRGPGRVPIIQGASQRSYRAQKPWQCPGMCPGEAQAMCSSSPGLKTTCFQWLKTPWKKL